MAGKGDKRRPRKVDEKTFEDNWNRIFKKKKEVTLPTYDNKPNENMFDDLNLKNKTLTKDVPPDILE
jgi:hypothetical protein|tara:strand:+ start:677 stop:877 length:201 start_codon:yes stop_codon:yes gene_type:complete